MSHNAESMSNNIREHCRNNAPPEVYNERKKCESIADFYILI